MKFFKGRVLGLDFTCHWHSLLLAFKSGNICGPSLLLALSNIGPLYTQISLVVNISLFVSWRSNPGTSLPVLASALALSYVPAWLIETFYIEIK